MMGGMVARRDWARDWRGTEEPPADGPVGGLNGRDCVDVDAGALDAARGPVGIDEGPVGPGGPGEGPVCLGGAFQLPPPRAPRDEKPPRAGGT